MSNDKYNGSARNLWRKVYGYRNYKPREIQVVNAIANITYSLDLNKLARQNDYFEITGVVEALTPVLLVNPSIEGTILIGNTLDIVPGNWSGTPSLTYTLNRDGVAVGGLTDVSFNTLNTYVLTTTDIGPALTVTEFDSVSSTSGTTNSVTYAHATHLSQSAIGVSTLGTTVLNSTTGSGWAGTLGGLTCSLTQSATASCPQYSATGGTNGLPIFIFDGVNDVLKAQIQSKGSSYTDFEFGIVGYRIANVANAGCWIIYESLVGSSYLYGIRDLSNTQWRASDTSLTVTATSDPDSVYAHYSADAISGSWAIRKNGTAEATALHAFQTNAATEVVALGGRSGASQYANIAVQAWYFGSRLSTTQRDHLRALLTYYTGISS